jgi:hypothetical protein
VSLPTHKIFANILQFFCKKSLKGALHEIFYFRFFCRISFHRPLITLLGPFQILIKIHISSRWCLVALYTHIIFLYFVFTMSQADLVSTQL